MGIQINTNIAALNACHNLNGTQGSMQTSIERLSLGLQINRAADDATGLAIPEKPRSQINRLNQAQADVQDGVSLIQIAERALDETLAILQRMRTLAAQSASDTTFDNGTEVTFDADLDDDDISSFHDKAVTGGGLHGATIVSFNDDTSITIDSAGAFDEGALKTLDEVIKLVSDQRADLGALQNRLARTVKSLDVSAENLAASESRLHDTDLAKEMTNLTRSHLLEQVGVSILAQSNQASQTAQSVLRLLG